MPLMITKTRKKAIHEGMTNNTTEKDPVHLS